MTVLREVRRLSPGTDVVLMTAHATAQNAEEAMKQGAADYLIKPFAMDEFRLRVGDRKSTRLNSSHDQISYAVFCLKKKKKTMRVAPAPRAYYHAPTAEPTGGRMRASWLYLLVFGWPVLRSRRPKWAGTVRCAADN